MNFDRRSRKFRFSKSREKKNVIFLRIYTVLNGHRTQEQDSTFLSFFPWRIKFLRHRVYGYDYNGLRAILLLRTTGIGEWSAEAIK